MMIVTTDAMINVHRDDSSNPEVRLLLGGLFRGGFLGSRLLGGGFFRCWFLCLGLSGGLLRCLRLLGFSSLSLLGGLRFLGLVSLSLLGFGGGLLLGCLGLLRLGGLGLLRLLGFDNLLGGFSELEASRGSGSLGVLQAGVLNSGAESHLQMGVNFALIASNLEVLADVLQDGLSGGTSTLLKGGDRLLDHLAVLRMSRSDLRLGSSLLLGGSLGGGFSGCGGVRHGDAG